MVWSWLILTLLGAVLDWTALLRRWTRVLYFIKPAPIVFLMIWVWQISGLKNELVWFEAALFFSLIGDVALLFPKRFFVGGVAAFGLAHISYVIGFNQHYPPWGLEILVLLFVVGIIAFLFYKRLRSKMARTAAARRKRGLIIGYGLMLCSMAFSALLTILRPDWPRPAAFWAGLGGALFFTSDSLLVYSRFALPFSHDRVWVHVTYHLAQIALVLGAVMKVCQLVN
jgi:uncharacterized membrane protein YhhN